MSIQLVMEILHLSGKVKGFQKPVAVAIMTPI